MTTKSCGPIALHFNTTALEVTVNKNFGRDDIPATGLAGGEFEGCVFRGCGLQGANLSGSVFEDCIFEDCDLSMALLRGTALRTVRFVRCKMLGLQFGHCNPVGLTFSMEVCRADDCSLCEVKLPRAVLCGTRLRGADFTGCDLREATLTGCDFTGATFNGSMLERADFRGSEGISIDPLRNRVKHAKFSLDQTPGLLEGFEVEIFA